MKGISRAACLVAVAAALTPATGSAAAAGSNTAPIAPASARGVTEFSVEAMRIFDLAQGSDGTISYIGAPGGQSPDARSLGRVGPSGPLGEVGLANYSSAWITSGSDGDTWLSSVHETGPGGFLEISLSRRTAAGTTVVPGTVGTEAVAPAVDGGVWIIQNEPDPSGSSAKSHLKIGRVSASGTVTSFPFAEHKAGLTSIVEGHEGDAWFTEFFASKIGRITLTGKMTSFQLPERSLPQSIAVDSAGSIWFSEGGTNRIGRITPAGKITEFKLPEGTRQPRALTVGADGRIWFTETVPIEGVGETGNLGRITPTGRFTQIELPDRESEPVDLISGTEGNVWYSAMGERHCEGGGLTCQLWEPKNPAIVGRVEPTTLKTVVTGDGATVGRRGVKVPLACGGGDAWSHCRGRISVKVGDRRIATAKYTLEADQARGLVVPFARGVTAPLRGRRSKSATVAVVATSGKGSSRPVSLRRGARAGAGAAGATR